MRSLSERRLVRRFLTGDEGAFSVLYDRHAPAMYQFALRLVGGHEPDAEDVVQEAWMRAASGLPEFGWRSRLRTWLMGITLNCAREVIRRRGRRESPTPTSNPAYPGRSHATDIPDLALERAIAGLPDESRVVLLLHDLEGYTHREIAERLGIAEGTSKSRLSRGRSRVRSALDPEQENQ